MRGAVLVAVITLACAPSATAPSAAAPESATTVAAVPATSAVATPSAASSSPKVRFPPGADAPRLGCFAWSEKTRSFACVWGHFEAEPEGRSLWVVLLGADKRALVRIVGGALDDATRATLDEAMRSGDFREVEERPWTPTGTPLELASFRVVTEGETIRIEHSGHSIFERTSKSIPRFTPTCEARVRSAGEDVVVERRCRVMDEGIEVIEMDVYRCDERACK